MENNPFAAELPPDLSLGNPRAGRTFQERVTASAEALLEQGVRPTVTRVRAAMGGGSPNDIAPVLKHWKDVVLPAQGRTSALEPEQVGIPPILADVVREFWSRALAAASVEIRGGAARQKEVAQDEQVRLLRQEITMLRDRLQREGQAYGELRAQSARHEVIAKDALKRAADVEARLAEAQRTIGLAQGRIEILRAESHRPHTTARSSQKKPVSSAKAAAEAARFRKRHRAKAKSRAGRRPKKRVIRRHTRT